MMIMEKSVKKRRDVRGEKNPFYGKHHTIESKEKIRKKLKGRHLSPDTEFTSESTAGEKNPFYGRHHTKETIDAISKKNIRQTKR